jgi:hypothetical protein
VADSGLFTAGSLFTADYLVDAIRASPDYLAVDVAEPRKQLDRVASAFPQSHRTNESQTEDDFI